MSLFQSPEEIQALFTRQDGSYAFARWGRPIAPIVFGVDDATLQTVKGAVEAVVTLAGHQMAETDPELGSNLMFFFFRDWPELLEVPDLDRMIPNLADLVGRLTSSDAAHYRAFRFDDENAIQAAFVFIPCGRGGSEAACRRSCAVAGCASDADVGRSGFCDDIPAGPDPRSEKRGSAARDRGCNCRWL